VSDNLLQINECTHDNLKESYMEESNKNIAEPNLPFLFKDLINISVFLNDALLYNEVFHGCEKPHANEEVC